MYFDCYYDFDSNKIYIFDDKRGIIEKKYSPYCYQETDEETPYKTIYGNPVKRIRMKSEYKGQKGYYETDINPTLRYLIDNYYDDDRVAENRIAYWDIETSSKGGFPDMNTADKEVLAITLLYNNKYIVFVLDVDNRFTLKSTEDIRYFVYNDESTLLYKFIQFIDKAKINVLVGWNSYSFDMPYLYRRACRILGEDEANKLSPIEIVTESVIKLKQDTLKGYRIPGLQQLDYMLLYKKYAINSRESYSLDFISSVELGDKKVEYDGSLQDLYEKDINKFIEYNIHDVRLIVNLENKLHYLDVAINSCHLACISYESVFSQTKIIEGIIFRYLKNNNLVSKNKDVSDGGTYEGAFVRDATPNLYYWTYFFDVQSLYPNILINQNISPETKVGKIISEVCNLSDITKLEENDIISIRFQKDNSIKKLTKSNFLKFIYKFNLLISYNGVIYTSSKQGVVPTITEILFDERVKYKNLSKDAYKAGNKSEGDEYDIKQYVRKILINSIYGALGMAGFRFYDRDNAEAITLSGQDVSQYSAKFVNKWYKDNYGVDENNVIYGDTDSLNITNNYLLTKLNIVDFNECINKTLEIGYKLNSELNNELKSYAKNMYNSDKCRLKFVFEIIGSEQLLLVKKNYLVKVVADEGEILEKPKYKNKGVAIVRSDFPKAFKPVLKDIYYSVMDRKGYDDILEFLIKFKESLSDANIIDIAIPKRVNDLSKYYDDKRLYAKGATFQAKAAINHNYFLEKYELTSSYRKITNGDKIKIIKLKNNELGFGAIAFKDDNIPPILKDFIDKYVDRNGIVDSVLTNKLQSLYDILGWGTVEYNKNIISEFI